MAERVTVEADGSTTVVIEGHVFRLKLFGRHQVYNLLAAYAIARTLGYRFDGVDTESLIFSTSPLRGQILHEHGVTIIADCYNANPDSVSAGLKTLAETPVPGRLFIVLGDMLELGADSPQFHREVGRALGELQFSETILVGHESLVTQESAEAAGVEPARLQHFQSSADAAEYIVPKAAAGDTLYIKGSRGIGLEKIIERLHERGGAA